MNHNNEPAQALKENIYFKEKEKEKEIIKKKTKKNHQKSIIRIIK